MRCLQVQATINCAGMNGPHPPMNEEKVQLSYEILQYLIDNPNAQDTFDGIVDWWLLERTVKRQSLLVKEALSMLVADRLVLERKGRDTRTYYKINGRRRGKIISLLQKRFLKNRVSPQ